MSCQFVQAMVDRPQFGVKKQTGRRENQVVSKKTQIIRPDKRKKVKYL